jgi:hypothetical protein
MQKHAKLNLHAPMERPQLIQVGLWIRLLGIYYKRNRSKMMPNFLGNTLLEISEITNKTYSVKPNRYLLYWNHQKILGERIEALDEQTQLEQLLNMISILNELELSKDTVD